MATVLFSCPGTTDPIRGHRDGPILHILRKYRPDAVINFMSNEVHRLAREDNRYQHVRQHLAEQWGYTPQWEDIHLDIDNPSKLDLLSDILTPALKRCLKQHDQDQILINLSSGTPQMQIMMMDLALDMRYRCIGIQVPNPDNASGRGKRTNDDAYDITAELRENLDELPGSVNRCVEPKLIAARRQNQWEQLQGILELRDFDAAAKLKELMPVNVERMVSHLQQRSHLNRKSAAEHAKTLLLKDKLHPIQFVPENGKVERLCEYYLILRNMQKTNRITEFVLRLNPFIVNLQVALIDQLLKKKKTYTFRDLIDTKKKDDVYFMASKLEQKDNSLLLKLDDYCGWTVRDTYMSIILGNAFLHNLGAPESLIQFFNQCEKLNSGLRNDAAHSLADFTESDVRKLLGYSTDDLIKKIEHSITVIFHRYPPEKFEAYFQVYDFGIQYILENR